MGKKHVRPASRKSLVDMTDEERLHAINERYMGRMDTFVLTHDAREQLALDLGVLFGMCARLLEERRRRRG